MEVGQGTAVDAPLPPHLSAPTQPTLLRQPLPLWRRALYSASGADVWTGALQTHC